MDVGRKGQHWKVLKELTSNFFSGLGESKQLQIDVMQNGLQGGHAPA